ncbi:MAG: DUF2279 domain-containing protein [Deltaproteobacteria bacterium]|nr:DUF2279 domain-containing protein [Deltaproteobacteria bacterium]MBN2673953.1 DUF2279 domain-containing protein [Deltaproteobacteria bacterium]
MIPILRTTFVLSVFLTCFCAGAQDEFTAPGEEAGDASLSAEPGAASETDATAPVSDSGGDTESVSTEETVAPAEESVESATAPATQPVTTAAAEAPAGTASSDSTAASVEGPTQPETGDATSATDTPAEAKPPTQNPFIALGDEMFLGVALISAWGTYFWDWWQEPFHFKKEHGFTRESSTGGADKTGHFFTAYIFADFLNWRLRKQGWSRRRSAIVGSSVAMGLMTWIEVGDATSEYGWSWEDMLADFIGVAISAGLAMSPVADELIDFRLEYWPTSSYLEGGVMAADYSGMKYMMALRMTGIKPLKRTPLRFIEWHMGFYSRGFRSFDNTRATNRVFYLGMGIDMREIFDLFVPKKYKRPFDVAFTYYQVPYTSWTMKKWEHKWQSSPPPFTPYVPKTDD